jgi:hypothetical protein
VGLSDGDHVRNLLGRYCDLMDAGFFDAVGELFSFASLVDDTGRVLARGAAEVADHFERITRRFDTGGLRTKHLVLNTVLEEATGDHGRNAMIIARSSYVVLQATGPLPLQAIMTGRYVDKFVHVGGEWQWSERAFIVDQMGDLSHHLKLDLA